MNIPLSSRFLVLSLGLGLCLVSLTEPLTAEEIASPSESGVMVGHVDQGRDEGPGVELTLERAIELAVTNHPQIREADARHQQASAGNRDARSRLDWQVRVEGRQVHLNEVPVLSGFPPALRMPAIEFGKKDSRAAAITAQKVLSSGGKLDAGVDSTRISAEGLGLAAKRSRQVVAFNAEREFLQLVLAQRESEVAGRALETAEEYLRVARSRREARSAAEFDVLRAEVQVEEARQDLIRSKALIATARAALGQTLAVPVESWHATEDGLLATASLPVIDEAIRMALACRPDFAGAQRGILAARATVKAARGERRPTLALVADYQQNDPETTTQINRWSAGIVAGFPVFDGGHGRAAVDGAKAGVAQQEASREALRNQIEREVRQAHARVESSLNQVGVAAKRLGLAEEMLRIAHVRYSTGISTVTEVADAQTSVTRARQGHVRALSDLRVAEAELRLAMGSFSRESKQ